MNQRVWISDNNTDMGQPKYLDKHVSVCPSAMLSTIYWEQLCPAVQ